MQEAAQPGARAHGFVTGVQEYGVFVSFCNGVRGLAPTQQLGLEPNQDPTKQFPIGKASSLCNSRADLPPLQTKWTDVVDSSIQGRAQETLPVYSRPIL